MQDQQQFETEAARIQSADNNTWKIDKKIPITLIVLLMFQTLGFVWSAAQLTSKVETLDTTTQRLEERISGLYKQLDERGQETMGRDETMRLLDLITSQMDTLSKRIRRLEAEQGN